MFSTLQEQIEDIVPFSNVKHLVRFRANQPKDGTRMTAMLSKTNELGPTCVNASVFSHFVPCKGRLPMSRVLCHSILVTRGDC